jgi:outer membrane protein assembly factor BamA
MPRRHPRRYLTVLALALLLLLAGGCGPKVKGEVWVHDLTLRGVKSLKTSDVLEGLATQKTGWWPLATKEWLEPSVLDLDLKRIVAYYAENGFFGARVVESRIVPRKGGESVDIVVEIEEGPETVVRAVAIRGDEGLPAALRAELARSLQIEKDKRFSYSRYIASKTALVALLAARGYAYAAATGEVRVHRESAAAEVELRVAPGPLVRIGKIRLEGNGPIPADKLLHRVRFAPGEIYDPDQIQKTKVVLFQQRVFSSVQIELPKEPAPVAPPTIRVEVGKLRELRLGGGVGLERRRHEVRLAARYTVRNFLGGLRTLTFELRPAYVVLPAVWSPEQHGPAVKADIGLRQPDLFGSDVTVFGKVGYDLGTQEGYQYHGPRVQVGAERDLFASRLAVGLTWNLQYLDFFNYDAQTFDASSTQLGLGFKDPYRLAWLEQYAQLDLRDSSLDPRSGFYGALYVEEGFGAVGSAFTYVKLSPEARGYIPLGTRRLVLALRASFGYIWTPTDGDSPLTHRYYLGGPSSHRGFSFGRLSPQIDTSSESRIPIGGNAHLLLCTDLRLRVVRLFGYWLNLVAFFDAGDVVPSLGDLDLGALHLAVGGSLSYDTPIGAIRFGVGVRLNRLAETAASGLRNPDPGERIAYHITIGEAF